MRGLIHFRFIFLVVLPSSMFVAQCFWFRRARRLIRTIEWPAGRYLLQRFWFVAILLLLSTVIVQISGHWFPHRYFANGMASIARLWLVASFLAFLAVISVELIEWLSRSAR